MANIMNNVAILAYVGYQLLLIVWTFVALLNTSLEQQARRIIGHVHNAGSFAAADQAADQLTLLSFVWRSV